MWEDSPAAKSSSSTFTGTPCCFSPSARSGEPNRYGCLAEAVPARRSSHAESGRHGMHENSTHAAIAEIAAAERIDGVHVGRVLRLTLQAPDIVEALLDGKYVSPASALGSPSSLAGH